jgi:Glycosyltransferase family 87
VTNHVGAVFKVPPFYGMLFTPFVFQDGLQILLYHRILNVAIMLATAGVWLAMFRPRPIWWGVAAMAILLNSRPLADTIAYGQIDLLLLLLLSCALWAMREDRDGLAGALIALGALFKIYPVILLAFFVLKWRWRGVAGFVAAMLALNGVAVAVMGWEMHRVYLFEVVPKIGGTTSWVENQTISAFMARLVDVPFDAHLLENRLISLTATAISGLISLLACWLTMRPADGRSTAFALQYGQFLLLMVLAVPAAWMHYETLLVLVFAVLLLHLREREVGLGRASALALGFALVSYGNQWSFNGTTVMGVLTVLGVSYKFYGMLLLGAVLTSELRALPAPAGLPFLRGLRRPGALPSGAGRAIQRDPSLSGTEVP